MAIQQRVASTSSKPPAGNIHGEWTHDLHTSVSAPSLASRITAPGAKPPRSAKRTAKLANALQRADPTAVAPTGPKFNPPTGPKAQNKKAPAAQAQRNGAKEPEISIRGLAGPFSVLMQNFAPGTTAADIESVMTPVGGEMLVCRVVKNRPIMLAEMVFGSREAGDKVIQAFDGKTVRFSLGPSLPPLYRVERRTEANGKQADGRVIKVYPNPQGYQPEPSRQESRPVAQNQVIDGSLGFTEGGADAQSGGYSSGNGGLYSDSLVGGRGRGVRGDWSR